MDNLVSFNLKISLHDKTKQLRDTHRLRPSTPGKGMSPCIVQIGLTGIFSCGFWLEYPMIYGHLAFRGLFRAESEPEMRFGSSWGPS